MRGAWRKFKNETKRNDRNGWPHLSKKTVPKPKPKLQGMTAEDNRKIVEGLVELFIGILRLIFEIIIFPYRLYRVFKKKS